MLRDPHASGGGSHWKTAMVLMLVAAALCCGGSARAEPLDQTISELADSMLTHEKQSVREESARILGRIGGDTAYAALEKAGFLDWPMWRYDAARSSNTPMPLADELHLQWVRELPQPKRAWPPQGDDMGRLDFDVSYSPVVMGERIFVPSMVTDSLTAYSIEDGEQVWRFYADGPVRVAPAAWDGKVYFASDDGYLYCLDAETGEEQWRFQGAPSDHRLLGNERIISYWAARGGPVVKDGVVYFAAGLWPLHGVFIYALDAETGDRVWVNDAMGSDYVQLPHSRATGFGGVAPQGYIAASEEELVVAGGRTPPAFLNRRTGAVETMALRTKQDGGYAVHAGGLGATRNEMLQQRVDDLAAEIEGEVFEKLAAHGRLFVTTEDGFLYCFGPDAVSPVRHEYSPAPLRPRTANWASTAQRLIDELGESEGYVLVLGAGSGELMRELLVRSDLHVVVVEANADKVRELRDELTDAGQYGRRAAVIHAQPATFSTAPYLFSMILSEDADAAGIRPDTKVLAALLEKLRPYGGMAYLESSRQARRVMHRAALAANVDGVTVLDSDKFMLVRENVVPAESGAWARAASAADVDALSVRSGQQFRHARFEDSRSATSSLRRAALKAEVDQVSVKGGDRFRGAVSRGLFQPRREGYVQAAVAADVDQVSVSDRRTLEQDGDFLFAVREGPLTGAGQWTHQHADASNTNFSPDSRAKTPLGVLWFGGPCNNNILPRHADGPTPQVSGGRVIIPGPESISARCVYTGRELWKTEFPGIGHPFTDQDKEERYQQGEYVRMALGSGIGASYIGSPFVSLPDAIFVRYKTRVYELAPESGAIVSEHQLPVDPAREGKPDWGHFSVKDDVIITTVEPQLFEDEDYAEAFQTMEDIKGRDWDAAREDRYEISGDLFGLKWPEAIHGTAWDTTSSRRLVVLDRHSGEILWEREANVGFRHNAIISGDGHVYVIDGLSEGAVKQLERRGETPDPAVLLALDPYTGDVEWSKNTDIFGTWLGYSEEYDILLEGGRRSRHSGRLGDEPSDRIVARSGGAGETAWEHASRSYHGPMAIRGDTVYLAPSGRTGQGWALDLITGEPKMREQPVTGETAEWTYARRYGCNTHNVSEYLITFRSGAAAFYDLEHDSGTGFFAGFRSGCTNNLIVADGVVNAPDYTRTCPCSYQHQTSLALAHMPDMPGIEAWTTYDAAMPDPDGYGINFGAPGRRVDATGLIWRERDGAYRRHASFITEPNGSIDWVAASGYEGNGPLTLYDLHEDEYTVRLHFAEPEETVEAGQRVFDLLIDGEEVLSGFDIVNETGGARRGIVKEFTVSTGMTMEVELRAGENAEYAPVISGIEARRNDAATAGAQ